MGIAKKGNDEATSVAVKVLVDACHAKGDVDKAVSVSTEASTSQGNVKTQAMGYELLAKAELDRNFADAADAGKKLLALGKTHSNKMWEATGLTTAAGASLKRYDADGEYLEGGAEEVVVMAREAAAIFEQIGCKAGAADAMVEAAHALLLSGSNDEAQALAKKAANAYKAIEMNDAIRKRLSDALRFSARANLNKGS